MPGARKALAVTCIALVVFAAVLPLGGVSLEWLVVSPVFILLPPAATAVVPREASRRDERSLSLFAMIESRGPPMHSAFA
jgi:hypothetical protein